MDTSEQSIKRLSRALEIVVVLFAVAALGYRASVYWLLPVKAGEPYGLGDIIDFAIAMLLFFISILCAVSAVALSVKAQGRDQHLAFRPAVVGITTFVVYYFLHPHLPRLM
jgi:hypothetical protein